MVFSLKKIRKSFSLVELSVVLLVMGFLLSLSLSGIHTLTDNVKRQKNEQKIQVIKNALHRFFAENRRLPRPMDYTISRNNGNYGKEKLAMNTYDVYVNAVFYSKVQKPIINATNVTQAYEGKTVKVKYIMYKGIIPFKELNLTENDIVDEYGNLFEYYVPDIMTIEDYRQPINNEAIYRIGYAVKNNDYGEYSKYFCFGLNNKNPRSICQASDSFVYGVLFSSNLNDIENGIFYNQAPYGLRVKRLQSGLDFANNGAIAYVVVSHGADGTKTCALRYKNNDNSTSAGGNLIAIEVNKYTTINSVAENMFYSAQNCINARSQNNVVGREEFVKDMNKEFIFYKGNKSNFFDDVVVYETIADLML